jgi:hypothetical protein
MEVSGHLHAPAALLPKKGPLCSLDRRVSGPHSRPGQGGEQKHLHPCRGSRPCGPRIILAYGHFCRAANEL